jgi:hypothetical protein
MHLQQLTLQMVSSSCIMDLATILPSSSIKILSVGCCDFTETTTTATFLKSVCNTKVSKLEMYDNRLGELGHAKLVANSLKDMQVTELTLEGNFFTEGDVFILLSECKGSRLRE